MKPRLSIKERFFGTWDRKFNSFTLILGILNSIVAFYTLDNPEQIPQYIVIRDAVITLSFLAIILYLVVRYLRKDSRLRKAERELNKKDRALQATLSAQLKYASSVARTLNFRNYSISTKRFF